MYATKLRGAWLNMHHRCYNPESRSFQHYGGRGIQVRFGSFEEFYAAIGDPPTRKHSVDRINNDGHYEVGNVRWADAVQQAANRRRGR